MNDNNDFKKLWSQQSTSAAPDTSALFEKANALKRKTKRGLWKANILLASTSVFILLIVFYFHPQMLTTKIGVLLVIAAMVSFLFVYNKSVRVLSVGNVETTAKEYLHELLALKQKQEFLQKTMLNLYFILLTSGILLYMVEYTLRMTLVGAAITYGVTLAWIALNWFYFRPRTIKKQQAELNEVIERLERVNLEIGN